MAVTFVEVISATGGTTVVRGSDGETYTLKGGAGGVDSRNNNPGAMKYGPRAERYGAIGQTSPPPGSKDGLGYAIFPTYQAGVSAYADLQQSRNGGKTIEQMVRDYARDEELPAYANYAADLARAAGVPPGTKISDLTPQQFAALQARQFQIEGAGTGKLRVTNSRGQPVSVATLGRTPSGSAIGYQAPGSSPSAVRETQQALAAAGFNPGPVDGIMGSRTQAAIRAFQTANGLRVDGIAGPQTQAVLAALGPRSGMAATGAATAGTTSGNARATGSADIRETQQALAAAGFSPGAIDGIAGPQTQAAVRAFQSANGLRADGVVGAQTRAALEARAAGRAAMPGQMTATGGVRAGTVPGATGTSGTAGTANGGRTSAEVTELQQALAAAGFNPGAVDGIMGPRTQAALSAYNAAYQAAQQRPNALAQQAPPGYSRGPNGTVTYTGPNGSVTTGGAAQGYIDQLGYMTPTQIADIQRTLNERGARIAVDGIAGAQTRAALQQVYGGAAVRGTQPGGILQGIIGPIVQRHVNSAIMKEAPKIVGPRNVLSTPRTAPSQPAASSPNSLSGRGGMGAYGGGGTISGSSTGQSYNVGQSYNAGGYKYTANADGTFTNEGRSGSQADTPGYTYDPQGSDMSGGYDSGGAWSDVGFGPG